MNSSRWLLWWLGCDLFHQNLGRNLVASVQEGDVEPSRGTWVSPKRPKEFSMGIDLFSQIRFLEACSLSLRNCDRLFGYFLS